MDSQGEQWSKNVAQRGHRHQKGAEEGQTGSKRESKGDQNAFLNRFSEKVPESIEFCWFCGWFLVRFGSRLPSKFDDQIDAKLDAEKVRNVMKHRCENGPEIDRIFREMDYHPVYCCNAFMHTYIPYHTYHTILMDGNFYIRTAKSL